MNEQKQKPKDQEFMKKHLLAEKKLTQATDEMEKLAASVTELTKNVKQGIATKSELNEAIKKLKDHGGKLKLLTAESRMLAGWTVGDENPPPPAIGNKILILISLIALIYLVRSK